MAIITVVRICEIERRRTTEHRFTSSLFWGQCAL